MNASRPYLFESERLGFGLWTPLDVPLARQLWGDPQVTRLFGGPFSDEAILERFELQMQHYGERGIAYWPLFRLSDGEFVGCCGLKPHPDPETLELGFHLRPAFWGQGYASEAARAVIQFAFGQLGVERLFAGHHPDNHDSKRVLVRLGFEYVGVEHFPPTDLMHLCYELKRPV